MDPLHIHLLLNHVPAVATALGVLVVGWGLFRKNDEVVRIGLATIVLAALAAGGTFLTGEPAEDRVGGLAGVSQAAIERHEEAAEPALVAVIVAGVVALLAAVERRRRAGALAAIVLGVVAFGLVARAANLGGLIRHTELGAAAPATTGETDDDDDR